MVISLSFSVRRTWNESQLPQVLKLQICSRDVNISLEQEVEPGMA